MTTKMTHVCTNCGKGAAEGVSRDMLAVKQVSFHKIGKHGSRLRSRTVAWLCPSCREADPDWNRPAFGGAPGYANTRIATSPGEQDDRHLWPRRRGSRGISAGNQEDS